MIDPKYTQALASLQSGNGGGNEIYTLRNSFSGITNLSEDSDIIFYAKALPWAANVMNEAYLLRVREIAGAWLTPRMNKTGDNAGCWLLAEVNFAIWQNGGADGCFNAAADYLGVAVSDPKIYESVMAETKLLESSGLKNARFHLLAAGLWKCDRNLTLEKQLAAGAFLSKAKTRLGFLDAAKLVEKTLQALKAFPQDHSTRVSIATAVSLAP